MKPDSKYDANNERIIHTREDGQIFGIAYLGNEKYQSFVPSDLADAGEGHAHQSEQDAEEYLKSLYEKIV